MVAKSGRRPRKPHGELIWKLLSLVMLAAIAAMAVYWWQTTGFRRQPVPPETPAERRDRERPEFLDLQVFFSNSEQDPESLRCGRVYPVHRRVPATESVARTALQLLLAGPTEQEAAAGYYSNLNPGVRLLSLELADGVATVDFSEDFATGVSGSCRVEAIRAQIQETLLQFDTVKEIRIRVGGQETPILQP
ncbi:MAG: hypothetical protein Kow001_25230 [Acidobacteriota bacterium]